MHVTTSRGPADEQHSQEQVASDCLGGVRILDGPPCSEGLIYRVGRV